MAFLGHGLFRHRYWFRIALGLTVIGFILHSLWLGLTLWGHPYPFIVGHSDAHLLISWVVVLVFLLLARHYRLRLAGAFFVTSAIIFLLLSSFHQSDFRLVPALMQSPWIQVHLFLAFLAFALFMVGFLVGVAFILQDGQLKARHIGRWVQKLPPLAVLEGIHVKAIAWGLLLLTAAIVAGLALNRDQVGVFFTWDPKQIWVLSTWFFYAAWFQLRHLGRLRGRRGILVAILGFVIVITAFFGLTHQA